jgi:hypothetical protein
MARHVSGLFHPDMQNDVNQQFGVTIHSGSKSDGSLVSVFIRSLGHSTTPMALFHAIKS